MFDDVDKLRRDIEETANAIEGLLDDYRQLVDRDMAGVIASYVRALHLDCELASTRGSSAELTDILEDLVELHSDTSERLSEVRVRGSVIAPLQS